MAFPDPADRGPAAFALALLLALAAGAGCAGGPSPATDPPGPSANALLGAFEDDYGHRFAITPESWTQDPGGRLSVVEWLDDRRSILARTPAEDRTADGDRWTRIDWVRFDDLTPWTWGFCLVVWDAPTREAALAAPPADPDRPRSGCNGFPYSRMRPAGEGPTLPHLTPEHPASP